jgi:hypothetical protein
MLNLLSLIAGGLALLLCLPGLIPLFGWLNWFVLPVAAVGLVLGLMSSGKAGRNLNIVVLIIAVVRLSLGGGIL